jgi:hypothetical protein
LGKSNICSSVVTGGVDKAGELGIHLVDDSETTQWKKVKYNADWEECTRARAGTVSIIFKPDAPEVVVARVRFLLKNKGLSLPTMSLLEQLRDGGCRVCDRKMDHVASLQCHPEGCVTEVIHESDVNIHSRMTWLGTGTLFYRTLFERILSITNERADRVRLMSASSLTTLLLDG